MAEKIKQADILISEVLFNPRNGSVDFIEIYIIPYSPCVN